MEPNQFQFKIETYFLVITLGHRNMVSECAVNTHHGFTRVSENNETKFLGGSKVDKVKRYFGFLKQKGSA